MKKLLAAITLTLVISFLSISNADTEKTIIADMLVTGKTSYGSGKGFYFQTPDKNFNKLLQWTASYNLKNFRSYDKESGTPCIRFIRAVTFDGKKIALIFKYSPGNNSQTNTCVP